MIKKLLNSVIAKYRDLSDGRLLSMHLGIFRGRALWADSVSSRMNIIASGDQFKPIRIVERLVVNCKTRKKHGSCLLFLKEIVN